MSSREVRTCVCIYMCVCVCCSLHETATIVSHRILLYRFYILIPLQHIFANCLSVLIYALHYTALHVRIDYDVMSRGIIKLDFPSVEMQGDESDQSTGRDAQEEEELLYTGSEAEEGIEEEKVVEAKEEVTGEMDETLSEETDKEADRVEEAKQVIPEVAKAVKAVSQRIKVVSTSVSVSSTPQRNILNGPWVSAVKSADVWGIGMELRNLRDGLAESCAERERCETKVNF